MHISNTLALAAAEDWAMYWRTGVDARLGVQVDEREAISVAAPSVFDQRILDAQQWELYGAADISKRLSSGLLAAGTRLSSTTQSSNLSNSTEQESGVSAFVGYRHALSPTWALSGYISHGYRVPSLTERFYRGETPRGQVLGDPDLRSEHANNVDVSLHYKALSSAFYLSVFQHDIQHYIEQITLSPSLQQYRNLDRAKIAGVNYQLSHKFSAVGFDVELKLGGQWLTGEDNTGAPIADIVPAQHRMSLSVYAGNSEGFVALTHRSASDDSVPGELPTNSVNVLSIGYNYALTPAWQLSLNVTNITDAYYVTSRDDLAPYARGQQWVFGTEYQF
ncbi:TonB-dependent receptor domain-containing protein [Arsukibacterium sp.]|uniref:TonB-dependent receptor domain-containing protein n=1 Tax=Arsukibacterium sp. TaxID=1977258 RepID=UPI00299D83D6|nr:TonB-dependent receptor [Arsukibacterium sp.]MDX1678710.1 TonB-dependent receptor [Arsukibacterium sp.]